MQKNINFVLYVAAAVLAAAAAAAFLSEQSAPGPAGTGIKPPAIEETVKPKSCVSLTQCDPGCYRGKQYCQVVCTANMGKTSCSRMFSGEEICAAPGYDPEKAFHEMMKKKWDALLPKGR